MNGQWSGSPLEEKTRQWSILHVYLKKPRFLDGFLGIVGFVLELIIEVFYRCLKVLKEVS